MIIGAWVFGKSGWPGVLVAAGAFAAGSMLDDLFGLEVGRYLAEWTLRWFQQGVGR